MKFKYIYVFIMVLFISCEGPIGPNGKDGINGQNGENGGYDKQIRLDVGAQFGIDVVHPDTLWHVSDTLYHTLLRFNKDYYVDVDSIIFECVAGTFTDQATCYVELINLTDNVPITSSLVFNAGPGFKIVSSKNIYNQLPNKEITLGIQTKCNASGKEIYSARFTIYLYRS